MTRAIVRGVACAALLWAGTALAALAPQEKCRAALAKAAGAYAACQQYALAKNTAELYWHGFGYEFPIFSAAATKCRERYARKWEKLRARPDLAETSCSVPRFLDNGDGTVTDMLTGLQWEAKTNFDGATDFAEPHDGDNRYTWGSSTNFGPNATGSAFTDFLAALNTSPCFASQCDWRLPNRDELQTISYEWAALPASTDYYWTGTVAYNQIQAWIVHSAGWAVWWSELSAGSYVRAVRGGL